MNRRRLRLLAAACLVACSGGSTNPPPGTAEIAVHVDGVIVDERDLPVVLLRENDGPRLLPIWIGTAEATAIARYIHDAPAPRPDTHDLAQRLLEHLDARVDRVVVTELRAGTYYGVLYLNGAGATREVDVRPSDGIALAVRTGAPIFVRESVLDAAGNEAEEVPQPEAGDLAPEGLRNAPATPGRSI